MANSALVQSRRDANSPLKEMCWCSVRPLRMSARIRVSTRRSCMRGFAVASANRHPMSFLLLIPSGSSDLGRHSESLMKSKAPALTMRSCVSRPPMDAMLHSACAADPHTSITVEFKYTALHIVFGMCLNRCCRRSFIIVDGLLANPWNMSKTAMATVTSPAKRFRQSVPHRAPPSIITMNALSPRASLDRAKSARIDMESRSDLPIVGGGCTARIANVITARLRAAYNSLASRPVFVRAPRDNPPSVRASSVSGTTPAIERRGERAGAGVDRAGAGVESAGGVAWRVVVVVSAPMAV